MKKIEIYKDPKTGYLGKQQNWWFDPEHPDSFEFFDLDAFYPEQYFKEDHVQQKDVETMFKYVTEIYSGLTDKKLTSIFELGCGGGWYTKKYMDEGIDIIAIEGSAAGYEACLNRGIPAGVVIRHDLRKPIVFNRLFDICCCTEVAEHIEMPFASQLIQTITHHSDMVWFSFEAPNTNEAHYHHPNEQPEKFWINLFDFFGYGVIKIPSEIYEAVVYRGSHIFYNRERQSFNKLIEILCK